MCISGIERNVIILRVLAQIWVNLLNSTRKKTGCKGEKKRTIKAATTSEQNAPLSEEVMDLRVSQFAASMFHQFFRIDQKEYINSFRGSRTQTPRYISDRLDTPLLKAFLVLRATLHETILCD